MHKEILNDNQIQLLDFLKEFKREYYMAGGTAIALHLGHRMSVDFDLFKLGQLKKKSILEKISKFGFEYTITRNVEEQLNLNLNQVKFTFLQYPYTIDAKINFESVIKIPNLITLAAMKAFALGRRSKWKDYVDLFFILKNHYDIKTISNKAAEIYGQLFSEKMFRIQLSYFEDIDYSEEIIFFKNQFNEDEIKKELIDISSDLNI